VFAIAAFAPLPLMARAQATTHTVRARKHTLPPDSVPRDTLSRNTGRNTAGDTVKAFPQGKAERDTLRGSGSGPTRPTETPRSSVPKTPLEMPGSGRGGNGIPGSPGR
jgi:hypothetical protein